MDKIQQTVLKYFLKVNEVTKDQAITVISEKYNFERSAVAKAIHLLLDAKMLQIIGQADTMTLTNIGQRRLSAWYKRINWSHHFFKLLTFIVIYLLGLFTEEIKNKMLSWIK